MEKRLDLQMKKEAELIKRIDIAVQEANLDATLLFEELKQNYISITPPEEEPPMMQYLTIDSLKNYKHGQSIKAGNIKLNMRKLINSIPGIVASSANLSNDNQVLKICAALILWKELRDVLTVEISREQAIVLVALWKNCDTTQHITVADGLNAVNILYKELDDCEMNPTVYNRIIDQLVSLSCIKVNDEIIWLCEWISKKYV